jgi:hypothetical protein
MGALRKSLWTIAAILAPPAPVEARDVCAALNRVAASSDEALPFASLKEAASDGTLLPGFGKLACRIWRGGFGGTGVYCFRDHAPANLDLSGMERILRDCLGVAPVLRVGEAGEVRRPDYAGQWGDPTLLFIASGLRYGVETDCGERCPSGRSVSVNVVLERGRPRI